MRALITGITGFVGSYLAEFLLDEGLEVSGLTRWRSQKGNIENIKKRLKLVHGDMRDSHSMENLINKTEPDYIFHLAAQSFVPMSWSAPSDTIETNVIGTIHLLEAVRKSKIDPKIQIAGSSEEYGLVHPEELPIKETNPLRPLSPYAVSKVSEDLLGWQYFKSYGLKTVRTRAFNHTGPRRGEYFVVSDFAKQISEIELTTKKPVIYTGNLKNQRDFTDVRDVVRAYWLALNKCVVGEVYNICSEKSRTIQSILDMLLTMTDKKIKVSVNKEKLRPSDVEVVRGDCSKFKKQTGWKPEIPFETTSRNLLDYWREGVKK